ncbi:MAG TPA: CoA ester lyase [Gaiellaceae bacterium]|nr:CoA ester lyase [Gaiellaceae bacterium]
MSAPPLTWLYVPGDRPDRVEKALASRAHAVIVDLEDGVAPAAKDEARENVAALLAAAREKPVFVRVNAGSQADLEVVRTLPLAGVLVPKVERPEDVPDGLAVHALVETARGVEAAFVLASHVGVRGLSLGEADLRSQTGASEEGLDWPRSRVINAAVAAGLPRPPQSVYAQVRDLDGLVLSCARGRALGHLGRSAIHPDQLEPIERAYLPTQAEVERARATIATVESTGVGTVGDGAFVDAAMLGAARTTIALADAYGVV